MSILGLCSGVSGPCGFPCYSARSPSIINDLVELLSDCCCSLYIGKSISAARCRQTISNKGQIQGAVFLSKTLSTCHSPEKKNPYFLQEILAAESHAMISNIDSGFFGR